MNPETPALADLTDPEPPGAAERQFAALCWRKAAGTRQILLITSRDTGRWIVPKGWPMKNRLPHEAAAIEAWEEAGVTGEIVESPLGRYLYDKRRNRKADLLCEVEVFALEVSNLATDFPEKTQRRRKWFNPVKAARKVAEPELRELILSFGTAPAV
ncbi:NUDIX hydrolase [Pseudogemmobacter faecipullorum]|uniref:NUDIX hydrolase n=1 Tax=Pseudogemmobacter faecipullorum TaxID=2755041 RepID=A0ABS8CMN3_9RHOB|nr:NUDIX hydrolase [Pseudogemmobacter faecipullorum]MCB5410647.1 NUDIX hydrolase [Pseudogemmobacter faecipullorum]